MKSVKVSIPKIVFLWESICQHENLPPKQIAHEIAKTIGFTPIFITLLAQESTIDSIRSQAIQAYYLLMEDEMIHKSTQISSSG